MASVIRPISDLRNNFNEISKLAHKEQEAIILTKFGKADIVVLSHAAYRRQQALLEIYEKLAEAEEEAKAGLGIPHAETMKHLRSKYGRNT